MVIVSVASGDSRDHSDPVAFGPPLDRNRYQVRVPDAVVTAQGFAELGLIDRGEPVLVNLLNPQDHHRHIHQREVLVRRDPHLGQRFRQMGAVLAQVRDLHRSRRSSIGR